MKLRELLQSLPREIRRDAQIILAHLLRVKPSQIHLLLESELSSQTLRTFRELIDERLKGKPTAYLIGEWDFFGITFKTREGVLVPRPETELLVEKSLELIPGGQYRTGYEIGLGTGCISITLLKERELLSMEGSDINLLALELSRENAKLHGVENRLTLHRGSMFEPVKGREFDFVVSNPPYIPKRVWDSLPPEVKREGVQSLIGGEKGYEFYEELSTHIGKYVKKGGFVVLEIGHDQGEIVKSLLEKAGFKVKIYKDYSGQDRIAIGWN